MTKGRGGGAVARRVVVVAAVFVVDALVILQLALQLISQTEFAASSVKVNLVLLPSSSSLSLVRSRKLIFFTIRPCFSLSAMI